MPRPWSEVEQSREFQDLSRDDREAARAQYWRDVVRPQIQNREDLAPARQAFFARSGTSVAREQLPDEVQYSTAAGGGRGGQGGPTADELAKANPPSLVQRVKRGLSEALTPKVTAAQMIEQPRGPDEPVPVEDLQRRMLEATDPAAAARRDAQELAQAAYRPGQMSASPDRTTLQRVLDTTNRKPLDNSLGGLLLETGGDAARGAVRGVESIGTSGWGLVRAGADVVGADKVAGVAAEAGKAGRRSMDAIASPDRNSTTQQVFESTFANVPVLLGLGAGSKALVAMGGMSAGSAYDEARNAGKPVDEALERGVTHGLAEMLGEKVALPALGKLFSRAATKVSTPELGHLLADLLVKEQVGEQATTAMQDAYDKFGSGGTRPYMTLSDYLDDAIQTSKVTLGQSLLMGGGAAVLNKLAQPKAVDPLAMRQAFTRVANGHGLNPKAAAAIEQQAAQLPPEKAPGFIERAIGAMERRGLVKKAGASLAWQQAVQQSAAAQPEIINQPNAPTAADMGWADGVQASQQGPANADQVATLPLENTGGPAQVTAQVWNGQPFEPAGQPMAGPDGRQYLPAMAAGKPVFIPVDEITQEAPADVSIPMAPSPVAGGSGDVAGGVDSGGLAGAGPAVDPLVRGSGDDAGMLAANDGAAAPVRDGIAQRPPALTTPAQPTTLGEMVSARPNNAPGFTAADVMRPAQPEAVQPEPPAAPARRADFESEDAVRQFLSEQRRNSSIRISAAPVQTESGWSFVTKDEPGYDEARQAATSRAEQRSQPPAQDLAGEKLNRSWTAFAPETGTKGVPRAEMPQVKAGDRSALVQYLRARGVEYEADAEIPAVDLKPTQAEFSPSKVKQAMEHQGGDRSILVSSDGYVVDGHHQWLAKREAGEPVKAIRLSAPIDELLPLVREFPSVGKAAGATKPTAQPADAAQQAAPAPEQAQAAPAAAEGEPVVVHRTSKGKELTGYVRKLTPAQAQAIDPYTFRKGEKGMYFVRKERADAWDAQQSAAAEMAAPDYWQKKLDAKKSTAPTQEAATPREAAPAAEPAGGVPAAGSATVEADGVKVEPKPGSRVTNPDGSYYTVPKPERKSAGKVTGVKPAPAPGTRKAEMRPYRRSDGSIGYEAVPIVPPPAPEPAAEIDPMESAPAVSKNTVFTEPAPAKKPADMAGFVGVSDVELALRRLSSAEQRPGDIKLGNDKFVTLDQAVAAAREAMTPKEWGMPFQFMRVLDIAPVDWGRMVNAMKEPAAAPAISANTVFTEDAAAKARALLKSKLGQLNSGIDPEVMMAGITLAGYHIEKGARTFAAYSKAMLADLGDAARPYLKSWYLGLRFDPRAAAFAGDMDSASTVEAASVEQAAEPAQTTGATEAPNDARNLDRASPSALEGVPAAPVQRAAGQREAERGAGDSRPADGGRDAAAGERGVQPIGGVGGGEGAVPVPARGKRAGRGSGVARIRDSAEREQPSGQPQDAGREGRLDPPQFEPADFTIEQDFALGEGGQKTKYRLNADAIRLVKALETAGRTATVDEQQVLAKYVGWGGIPQAFDEKNADWAKQHAELRELLTPDEWAAAVQSTQYAHYTSKEIIGGMYTALRRMGFTGGATLEAGGGVGNFIGLMPADMRTAGKVTLIERETIAAMIAKHLYPRQNVRRADFTEFGKGQDGQFDAQVGNPPFSSTTLTDQSGRKHLSGLSVHNYFIAKGIDLLREGGVSAVVVSNSFLDAKNDRARAYIADRTRFLGAIRLPNNAFAKNAGTEVTTDIVFFQKLPESEWGSKAAKADAKRWVGVEAVADAAGGKDLALNAYFAANPDMMLGQWGRFGTMYGPDQPALVAKDGQDTAALLARAVKNLPEGIYTPAAVVNTAAMRDAGIEALHDKTVAEGGFYNHTTGLWRRLPDRAGEEVAVRVTPETMWSAKQALGQAGFQRLQRLADMRRTVRDLLAAEIADDKAMDGLRKTLNEQYDAYVADAGPINDRATARLFEDDPDYPLLAALETDFEPGMGPAAAKANGIKAYKAKAKKSAIFDRRVVDARKTVTRADSPSDALNVAMAERGRLDAQYIGQLLGKDPDGVLEELAGGDAPLLFKDPSTGEYVLRDAYLSGNVRAKLLQARRAGMMANARALEAVQPEDVPASQIAARIGSPWVPTEVYQDFAAQLLGDGTKAAVQYMPLNSSFSGVIRPGSDVASRTTFGTPAYPAEDLLFALMNNREIKVTYRDNDGKTHVDRAATELANEKAAEIKDKFQDWLFKDADRAESLVRAYNDANNNYVTRQYDGSWIRFPGKVPDSIIKFRRHQRNAIARTIQDRTALYDHVVGAGKTFTAIAAAMELKRTGLARKPMIVVPNHLVKQWAADFYRLYPGAKILTATKADFERANRRKFLGKIATGDWDAVIIAHSSFGFIKPAPEFEARFNEEQVEQVMATIKAVEDGDGDERAKKRTVKQLEKMKERLENRVASLREKSIDDLLDLQQLGVDQLFVDEAHCFPWDAMVTTELGHMPIGELVESRTSIRVLSVDLSTGALAWKPVTNWFTNAREHQMVRIHHDYGVLECTANHQVWTHEDGYVAAGDLKPHHTLRIADAEEARSCAEAC